MNILIILPHQLFEDKYFKKIVKPEKIIIWEHPHYFTQYKYNKKKLMLHRASMQYYKDYLKNKGYTVKYCEYKDKPNVKKSDNTFMFDPIDNLKNKVKNLIESPNFIMTKDHYGEYRKKTDKLINNYYIEYGRTEWINEDLAISYAILREKDSMYHYLEKLRPIDQFATFINNRGDFDPYRKEERYKAILRQYYLPITHWNE